MSFAPEKNKGTGVPLPQAAQATATNATLGALNEAVPDKVTTVAAAAGQAAGLAGSVQQMDTTALVGNATSVAGQVIPGKISQNLQKAQQAAGLVMGAGSLLSGAGTNVKTPGINGINGNIPFDQLDTATATRVAMSQQALNNNTTDSLVAAIGEALAPYIKASVHIGEQAIHTIESIKITQEIGEHNSLELVFPQDQVQTENALMIDGAEKLLGKVAEIELYDAHGLKTSRLQNLFVIADVKLTHRAGKGMIVVKGYAPTWILDGPPHYETFYKKNLKTIAQSVTKPLGQVKASLVANPNFTEAQDFVCRFGESAWAFLKRLSAETGQWLYFNGKELIFGKPEAASGNTLVYGRDCYDIQMSMQVKPVQGALFDYEADRDQLIQSAANQYNGNAGYYNMASYAKAKDLFNTSLSVTNPTSLASKDSTLKAIGKSRAAGSVADMYYISGESTHHELRVGLSVGLDLVVRGQMANHAPIRIIKVQHQLGASGQYSNSFTAIPAAAEVPPPIKVEQPNTHPVLAQVIDNNDSKGRVRVKFLGWKQEGIAQTDFLRVVTPDAGGGSAKVATNRGLVTIPEVGDQVYVDFEMGIPERPFITGSVFHGKHGTGGGANNDKKSFATRGGTILTLNEADNSAELKDPSGNILKLNGDGTVTLTAPNTITFNTKDFILNAGNSITLNAQPGPEGGGEGIISINAKKSIDTVAQEEGITTTAKKGITLASITEGVGITGFTDVKVESLTAATSIKACTDACLDGLDVKVSGGGTIRVNSNDTDIT